LNDDDPDMFWKMFLELHVPDLKVPLIFLISLFSIDKQASLGRVV
jgi:hypothetical protein